MFYCILIYFILFNFLSVKLHKLDVEVVKCPYTTALGNNQFTVCTQKKCESFVRDLENIGEKSQCEESQSIPRNAVFPLVTYG